jgi:hypothetical protein
MNRLSAAAVTCVFVLVSVFQWQSSAVSTQGSVQACMNPNSGEIKVLVKGSSCKAGDVSLSLATGGTGDGRGPRVVDADGDDVGAYMGDGIAVLQASSYWLELPVNESGFGLTWRGPMYPLANCVGDAYLEGRPLFRWAGWRPDGQLHFAGNPIEFLTMRSLHPLNSDGSLGDCFNLTGDGSQTFVGPATSVPVPDGLTPPFRLVDP